MTVQAYYTDPYIAKAIAEFYAFHVHNGTILDLCAGDGRLSDPVKKTCTRRILVEPDIPQTAKNQKADRWYEMTAEEYANTYATSNQADVVVCNPPFSQRCGRTSIGESVQDLHLPEIRRFESYFLTLAAELTEIMVFILPDVYVNDPEALKTFNKLQERGWYLNRLLRLPINSFKNDAIVRTSVWVFFKNPFERKMWVESSMQHVKDGTHGSLFWNDFPTVTKQSLRGPVTGQWFEPVKDLELNRSYLQSEKEDKPVNTEPLWRPEARPIGSLWKRLGRMYQLSERGWVLANTSNYVNGEPVVKAFGIAKVAFECLKQGAFHCAATITQTIDLDALITNYGDLASASFLHLLPREHHDDPVLKDVTNLGMFEIPKGFPLPVPSSVQRIADWVLLEDRLTFAQQCRLYLASKKEKLDVFATQTRMALREHRLSTAQCNLISPWIPRELIATVMSLTLDEAGFYQRGNKFRNHEPELLAYLNRGHQGRVQMDAEPVFENQNLQFIKWLNDWDDDNFKEERYRIHAHYHVANSAGATPLMVRDLKLPLGETPHPWQVEDQPFMSKGGLISWDVGLGKTKGGVIAAMNHPGLTMIVTPKSVLAKWHREIIRDYPAARVAVLGFKPALGKDTFPADKTPLAKRIGEVCFGGRYDIVLTTHQVFSKIRVDDHDRKDAEEREALAHIGVGGTRSITLRRERFIQRAATRRFQQKESDITWTDLPIGAMQIIIDEADAFRALHKMPTGGWGERLIMSGSSGESKRAFDLLLKLDLLRHHGGKCVGLTATPITNSVAECFSMLRLFAPEAVSRRGVENVQQFIDAYCRLESTTSVSPKGEIVSGKAITGFVNTEDLARMWRDAMVMRTAKTVGLDIPDAEETVMEVQPTYEIESFIQEQRELMGQAIKEGEAGHVFQVMNAMNQCATYPPLVGLSSNPKFEALIPRLQTHSRDGGQVVFVELVEAQEALQAMLIHHGFEPSAIAVLNQKTSASKRLTLSDRYNREEIKIVITGAAGSVGVDLQVNTVAVHHISVPWHQAMIHQRNGRSLRQGNTIDRIKIYYWVMPGTTDAYRIATINTKANWGNALLDIIAGVWRPCTLAETTPDELLASLAQDPEEALQELRKAREKREREMGDRRFMQWSRALFRFREDPMILRDLERRIRRLPWVAKDLVDEIILRASVAHEAYKQDIFVRVSDAADMEDGQWRPRGLAFPPKSMHLFASAPKTFIQDTETSPQINQGNETAPALRHVAPAQTSDPAPSSKPAPSKEPEASKKDVHPPVALRVDAATNVQMSLFKTAPSTKPKKPLTVRPPKTPAVTSQPLQLSLF